jgi:hypothetical protein
VRPPIAPRTVAVRGVLAARGSGSRSGSKSGSRSRSNAFVAWVCIALGAACGFACESVPQPPPRSIPPPAQGYASPAVGASSAAAPQPPGQLASPAWPLPYAAPARAFLSPSPSSAPPPILFPFPPMPSGPSAAQPLPGTATRPLLGPLLGPAAWQAESRAVIQEIVRSLSPANAARVVTVPLVVDPNPNEVNAFAGCDDGGAPFIAGTEGLLEAIDAISQTKATDEMYGTQTYAAYVSVVAPRLVSKEGGSAMLPVGGIPVQVWLDPRRISRAHEIFDEIVAFTFGHELSHHYLGHTGCANGPSAGPGPAIARIGQLAASVLPGLNQPNEMAADTSGCVNTLDAGLARSARSYRWTEEGGLWLLDFFARLERASGANPWLGFLRTHPNPGLRIPVVQGVAATWRLQHAG